MDSEGGEVQEDAKARMHEDKGALQDGTDKEVWR